MAGISLLGSVPDLVSAGLRGSPLPRVHALTLRLGAIAGFVLVWSLLSAAVLWLKLFNPVFLPGPWTVIGAVIDLWHKNELWPHIEATLRRVIVGFGTGMLLAIATGLAAGHVRAVSNVVEPIVELLRPIPPFAVLPLFIVWVGIGEASKTGFITYATFFPMFLATVHAVRQVDPLLLRAAQSLGARRRQLFLRVILPAALPEIFTGLRLGLGLAFFVIVISEFIAAEHGLGYLINDGRNFFLVPQMLGAAMLLGLLGYAGNALVRAVERVVLRWQLPG